MTNENRKHWSKGAALKKKIQSMISQYIMAARVPTYKCPLGVEIQWLEPNMRRDIDNITSAVKFILDALVVMEKIPNDGRRYVREINHQVFHDPIDPRVIVSLIPLEESHA